MTQDDNLTAILDEACRAVGLDASQAEPIRLGENAIYRLPGRVVVRIARPGQDMAAQREVAVSRWLNTSGVPAVAAWPNISQPVQVSGRSVTFWEELQPHRQGQPREVGSVLRALHTLPVPADVPLGQLDPLVRVPERIEAVTTLAAGDREWLRQHAMDLRQQWDALAPSLSRCVVHGDAWAGNVVATDDGRVVLLDLERCSVGPPEWDLVSTAVKHVTYGQLDAPGYWQFCEAYGRDVTEWEHFPLLRDLRELRMTTYVAQHATGDAGFQREAELRVACLRTMQGSRPWPWTPAE